MADGGRLRAAPEASGAFREIPRVAHRLAFDLVVETRGRAVEIHVVDGRSGEACAGEKDDCRIFQKIIAHALIINACM